MPRIRHDAPLRQLDHLVVEPNALIPKVPDANRDLTLIAEFQRCVVVDLHIDRRHHEMVLVEHRIPWEFQPFAKEIFQSHHAEMDIPGEVKHARIIHVIQSHTKWASINRGHAAMLTARGCCRTTSGIGEFEGRQAAVLRIEYWTASPKCIAGGPIGGRSITGDFNLLPEGRLGIMNCGRKHQESPCEFSPRADRWTPLGVAVALAVFVALASPAAAQSTIVRASLTNGLPGAPVGLPPANQEVPSEDTWPRHAISRDGNLVVFVTRTPLAAQDTNSTADVYVRNIAAGTTTLVSLGTDGNAANATCYAPTISGDGQHVAFVSAATNLTAESTGGFRQVFARKLPSGPTVLISKSGSNAGDAHSALPALSNTGRYVSYESVATNLTADPTGGFQQVFLHDRDTDNNTIFDQVGLTSTSLMSRATGPAGAVGSAGSGGSALTDSGRFVAYVSGATNLVGADTNGFDDVFVRDRVANTTTRVSVGASGVESHGSSFGVTMSSEGRFLGFFSAADNLLAPALPVPQSRQAYVRDRGAPGAGGEYNDAAAANPNRVVSINPLTGQYGNNAVGLGDGRERVVFSPTGRFVAFRANSTNLGAPPAEPRADIYVHDRDADNDGILDETGAGQRATLRVSATIPVGTRQPFDCAIPAVGGSASHYLVAYESISDELDTIVPPLFEQNATGANVFRGECATVAITSQPTPSVGLCSGETLTLSVAASGTEPFTYQWKKGTSNAAGVSNQATYTRSGVVQNDGGTYTCVVTNACGSVTSAASVVTVSNAGINTQPQPPAQTKCPGSSVTWTVFATGGTYQWRKDGSNLANGPTGHGSTIANASSTNLQISALGPLDAGVYDCLVSTSCGSQTSVPVTLSIAQTPAITSQPAGAAVCIGQPFTLAIEATGPALSYQWLKNGVNAPSPSTAATYTRASSVAGDAGTYTCRVRSGSCNPAFEAMSQPAVVTVSGNPTISTQPLNQTACAGGSVSFSVAANGPNLQFQWRRGGNNLVNGGSISGATSPTLTINPVAPSDVGANYQCVVTGNCGSANSNTVALAVNNPPAITAQPTDLSLSAGDAATFRVTASGSTPLLYQWRKNDSPIAGATTPNLIINPVAAADAGQYDVVVSNPCNSATSFKATLTVAGGGGGGGGGDGGGGDGGGGGGGGTGGGTCGLFGAAAPEALLGTLTLMMLARSRTRRRNCR